MLHRLHAQVSLATSLGAGLVLKPVLPLHILRAPAGST
jgi:hypothetical protein